MADLFSERVATPAWRAEAQEWVVACLADIGREVTGAIEQPRIRPWSTQLTVPTDLGTVWFKANCPELAFEPAVHQRLSLIEPGEVEMPLAIDEERGWMMTADRGLTLGDSHDATLQDWRDVVALAATLQRRVASRGPELLGAGLPHCVPASVPDRFTELVDELAALPAEHASHLADDERADLLRGLETVAAAADTLSAAPLPATLQHGDLHPKNVFVVDDGLRIFDFGDAQWAHALEILAVPYGWTTRLTSYPWAEVLDAYAKVWADVLDRDSLEALLPAAMVTHAVNRSFTWLGAIGGAQPHELAEWGDAPLYYLRLALQPFPPQDPDRGP